MIQYRMKETLLKMKNNLKELRRNKQKWANIH